MQDLQGGSNVPVDAPVCADGHRHAPAFSHARPAPWRLLVPVLGQHQLLAAVMRGDEPSSLTFALPALVALGVTVLLLRWIAALLTTDDILYG